MRKRERANLQVRVLANYISFNECTAGLINRISFKTADIHDTLKINVINRILYSMYNYDSKKAMK
jgi:hypothetical protein